jgi:rod shape-determining protein MreD
MWFGVLITILLFYFFSLLQNAFFVHFSLAGAGPNLVFILFFLTVFFSQKKSGYLIFFYAVVSGLLLDFFTYAHFGLSVVLLIIIGCLAKKMQMALKEKEDKRPFSQFLPLFLIWLLAYEFSSMLYLRFIDSSHILMGFGAGFFAGIIYNLFMASVFFFIFKNVQNIQN